MARWSRTTLGFGMLLAGTAMLVLPGPGLVAIGGGLAVLAREYPWARAALDRVEAATGRLLGRPALAAACTPLPQRDLSRLAHLAQVATCADPRRAEGGRPQVS